MNGPELLVRGSGQPILNTCQITIKDLLSGMVLTLFRKRNSLARIQRLLSDDLKSRPYEVQTYRMCLGILNFTKKYSNKTLEECCKQAVALNKQKYTFIKNTIAVVADDLGEAGYHHPTSAKKEPVRGGYVMPPEASSIDTLLSRSKALADQIREGADE